MVIFILVLLGAFLLLYFIALKQKRDINKKIRKPDTKIVSRSGLRESKYTGELFSSTTTEDHLGKAAKLKKNAKVAIKNKLFDEAWKLLQKQKVSYMKHANYVGESPRVCQRLNNLRNWNYEKIKSLYIRIS